MQWSAYSAVAGYVSAERQKIPTSALSQYLHRGICMSVSEPKAWYYQYFIYLVKANFCLSGRLNEMMQETVVGLNKFEQEFWKNTFLGATLLIDATTKKKKKKCSREK